MNEMTGRFIIAKHASDEYMEMYFDFDPQEIGLDKSFSVWKSHSGVQCGSAKILRYVECY